MSDKIIKILNEISYLGAFEIKSSDKYPFVTGLIESSDAFQIRMNDPKSYPSINCALFIKIRNLGSFELCALAYVKTLTWSETVKKHQGVVDGITALHPVYIDRDSSKGLEAVQDLGKQLCTIQLHEPPSTVLQALLYARWVNEALESALDSDRVAHAELIEVIGGMLTMIIPTLVCESDWAKEPHEPLQVMTMMSAITNCPILPIFRVVGSVHIEYYLPKEDVKV
jgi:hypothetical protein